MVQYVDKAALVAEIEKLVDKGKYHEEYDCAYRDGNNGALYALKEKVHTLEVKEVDDELQGIEKEVAEDNVNAIDRERTPVVLKGEIKAKFKNEFNTLWQTVGGIQFANVAKHIIERLCLHFAAWGVYNLKGYCSISSEEKHKMDIKAKEVDLEKEIELVKGDYEQVDVAWNNDFDYIAKHFFELGLVTQVQSVWHDYLEPIETDKTILIVSPNGNSSLALWSGKELLNTTLGGGHSVLCKGDQWVYIEDLNKAQKGE